MKKNILLSAALMFWGFTASAQTTITFDSDDYKSIGVYDKWEESPFRSIDGKPALLKGNAGVTDNPDKNVDEILGLAPNSTNKVLALQRSRYGSNAFGVRIDLKKPFRVTKELQYIHVMTYLKDKPAESRMMVIGLGKRVEDSWSWQSGEDEQFWAVTTSSVKPKAGWQDIVVSFKGFSYSESDKNNPNNGIDIYSLIIVPDVRSPHADEEDWVAYFDEIIVNSSPEKRFSIEEYALVCDVDAAQSRKDRHLNKVGLTVGNETFSSQARNGKLYTNNTAVGVFSATAGTQVQPTFDWTGNAMHGYVYVDWGNDGLFKADVNDNGTPTADSDIVSYCAAEINGVWYNVNGEQVSDGKHISGGVPKFTVPSDTPVGFYRMRYKVDWNSLDPAGNSNQSNYIINNGGGILDVMLDVHGENVTVNASQLNGDIYMASNNSSLQNTVVEYGKPLTVKIAPAPGFVQYGFTLKFGYNVNAKEQFDDKGNPNWIKVDVPYSAINADGTYTIPGEYIRGGNVSIVGDMQQVQRYTVKVVGDNDNGGVTYANKEYTDGDVIEATQFFSAEQVVVKEIPNYTTVLSFDKDNGVLKVQYKTVLEYRKIESLAELSNDKYYHIKAKSGEGYFAWNTLITDKYVSLRGVTNHSHNNLPSNEDVANIYKETVSPFDVTVVWQILHEDGKYYLYNPVKGDYVTRESDGDKRDYIFTEEKIALDAIRDNGDSTFGIHAGGGYSDSSKDFACIVTNGYPEAVRDWTYSDHGAILEIYENPNIIIDDITSIDNVFIENVPSKGFYNLHGYRLESIPSSGVIIVDGEKILIK